ncbi:MAG: glycosyltransferase family 39 protein [Lachnospiraceae bacterium]|nr:glycosyltransferase family 39 protein [Lachnospiraceae bacterium]
MLQKNKKIILYILFLGLIGFMHIYRIDQLPRGLNVDEAGAAYDAFALGKYGVDRWRESWPLYLINYRDGQNILYTYLLVPVFLIFGTSIYTVRSVIIFSAFVMGICGAKIAKKVFQSDKAELLFLGMYAILPVFTITLRFGLESHLMMSAATVMLWCVSKAALEEKGRYFVALGIASGVTLYTYALSYLCVPVFLLLSLLYLIYWKKVRLRNFFQTAVPFALLAAPLLVVQAINFFDLPQLKIGVFTFTKLPKYRSSELTLNLFLKKIFGAVFHTVFYDGVSYNSTPKFGCFYYLSVPFIAVGLIWSIYRLGRSIGDREKCSIAVFPLFWCMAEYLMAGFLSDQPGYTNLTRMNGVLISLAIFTVEGIWITFRRLKLEAKWKKTVAVILASAYFVSFLAFAGYYFDGFDKDAYPYKWLFFEEYDKDALQYLESDKNEYRSAQIYLPFVYTYYLWWTKANPFETNISMEEMGADPEQIGRFHMSQGHNLNGEYLFYRFGYSEPEIELFRQWHFKEHVMGSYVLMTDPFGNPEFFRDNCVLSDEVTLQKAYLDAKDDGKALLYGWLKLRDQKPCEVTLELDDESLQAQVISEQLEENGTVTFIFELDYEEFYQSDKKLFQVFCEEEDGRRCCAQREILSDGE